MSRKKVSNRSKTTEKPLDFSNYWRSKTDTGHVLGIDFTKNPEQRELIRLINENDTPVIFCTGLAGTRKDIYGCCSSH